jgi:hypothetical protein
MGFSCRVNASSSRSLAHNDINRSTHFSEFLSTTSQQHPVDLVSAVAAQTAYESLAAFDFGSVDHSSKESHIGRRLYSSVAYSLSII